MKARPIVNRKSKVRGDFKAGTLGELKQTCKSHAFHCKQPQLRKPGNYKSVHTCVFIKGTENEVCTKCGFTRPLTVT